MKRLLVSTVSAAVSLSMVAPAFAYIQKNEDISAQTSPYHDGRPSRRVIKNVLSEGNRPTVGTRRVHYGTDEREVAPVRTNVRIPEQTGGVYNSVRTMPEADTTGRVLLQRAEGRRLRRLNRTRKPDSDRYRTLNLRTNPRSLRQYDEDVDLQSLLPESLVQTGGNSYDRPTRRDIRSCGYTNRLNDCTRSANE